MFEVSDGNDYAEKPLAGCENDFGRVFNKEKSGFF